MHIFLPTNRVVNYCRVAFVPMVLALVFVIQTQAFNAWLHIVPLYLVRCSLVSFSLGILLYGPSVFFGARVKRCYLFAISIFVSLLFIAEYLYFSYFGTFMQASVFKYAGQSFAIIGIIVTLLTPKLFLFLINILIVALVACLSLDRRYFQPFVGAPQDLRHEGAEILDGVRVGYYSQDFATLDYNEKVFDSLQNAMPRSSDAVDIQEMRSIAAGFLITGELMEHKVGDLSEGQKGLLFFARLVLMCPGLLILDEPTIIILILDIFQ